MKLRTIFCFMALSLKCYGGLELHGEWKLKSMIYQGSPMELPNPDLRLSFTFYDNGTARLYWDRGSVEEFCERTARYSYENQILEEEVISINSQNAADCVHDPDMQLGRKTKTKVEVKGPEMHMHLGLADDALVYVFSGPFVSSGGPSLETKCLTKISKSSQSHAELVCVLPFDSSINKHKTKE